MATDDNPTLSAKDLHSSVCGLQRLQEALRNLAAVTEIANKRLRSAHALIAHALQEEQRALKVLAESEQEFLGTGDDLPPAVLIGFDPGAGETSVEYTVKYGADGEPWAELEDCPTAFAHDPATCIGCGCTDIAACLGPDDQPCHWLRLDREKQSGVCSECPSLVETWDQARQMQPDGSAG